MLHVCVHYWPECNVASLCASVFLSCLGISVARCMYISVARCMYISVARCVLLMYISVARCVLLDVCTSMLLGVCC